MIKIEVCANSVQDCLVAQNEGADRIELISASYLGGLTPTLTVVRYDNWKWSRDTYNDDGKT